MKAFIKHASTGLSHPRQAQRSITRQHGQAGAEGLFVLLLAALLWAAIVQIGQLQDMAVQAQHASRVAAFAAAHNSVNADTTAIKKTHFEGSAHQWHNHAGQRLLPNPDQVLLRFTQQASLPAQAQPGESDTHSKRLRREWQLEDAGVVRAAVTMPLQTPFAPLGHIKLRIHRHTSILRDAGHSPDAILTQRRVAMSAYAWADAAQNSKTIGQSVQNVMEPVDAAWHRPSPNYDWLMPWADAYPGQVTHE